MISPFPKKRTEKREKKRTGMSAPVKKYKKRPLSEPKPRKKDLYKQIVDEWLAEDGLERESDGTV